jgi:hypothetical protein
MFLRTNLINSLYLFLIFILSIDSQMRYLNLLFILLLILLLNSLETKAQFIKGFGATAGATFSKHKWFLGNPEISAKKKYIAGGNASGFIEYIDHKYYRMISELQYNMKGAREKIDSLSGTRYRANYISFNNFFKIRQELYDVTPYALAGPRVEFLLNSSISGMRPVHITASGGVGMEFLYTRPWIIFAEIQYNPDVMKARNADLLKIRQNAWEIRVGLKYERKKKADCPRPKGGKNF